MIVCIQFPEQFEADIFLQWMDENIGGRNGDWDWHTSYSVKVKNPQKALLVALRWGAK